MRKALNRAFSVAVLASAVGTCAVPALADVLEAGERQLPAVSSPAYAVNASDNESQITNAVSDSEPASAANVVSQATPQVSAPADQIEPPAAEQNVASENPRPAALAPQIPDSEPGAVASAPGATAPTEGAVNSKPEGTVPAEGIVSNESVVVAPAEKATSESETAVPTDGSVTSPDGVVAPADGGSAPTDGTEAPAAETTAPAENTADAAEGEGAKPMSTVTGVCLFGGVVQEITPEALTIAGTASNGEPLVLEFVLDADSEVAVGMKKDDKVVVYYEETEQGGYRVTSARYLSGDFPKNVFPSDLAEQKAEAERKKAELQNASQSEDEDEDVIKVVGIEVEGNSATTDEEILKVVSTRVGDPLLDPRIRRDMQAIYDSGYFTDVRLDTRFAPGGVRLVFRVLENPVVKGIELEGNKVATTEKLMSLMQTEPGKVLNTRVLQSDLQAINKYYNDELNFVASPSHITAMDIKDGILHLTIIDGVVIEKVEVTGVTVFPQAQVDALITSKPGDLYNRKTATDDADAVAKLYEKEDYLIDNIRPMMDPKTGVMTIAVTEAQLEEVKIVGTVRTKDETILRNLRSRPGEVMRRGKIQKDMERLNRLGLFKKVEPELEPGSEPGKSIMILNVEEQKTGMATIGVGYAGGGSGAVRPGITGAISFSERNLFGEAKSISVNLQQGVQIGSYGISYFDPAINDAQDSIGVNLYYNNVTELQQAVDGADYGTYALYDQRVYGGTFTYGHPIDDDLRIYATLRHDHIKLKTSDSSMYEPTGMGEGDLNSIALSALYDTRDDLFSPHHGAYGMGTFTYAGNLLGGKYDFMKFVCEGRYYVPVGDRCTVALRGMYGIVGDGAPASEFFYAGGTDTMRAYKDNFVYGTQMVVANAEFRFPIFNIKMLNGAVFVDAGNAWSSWSTNKGKIFTDVGIGLRIVFPTLGLGVIRLDYAHGQDGGRFSIGIGQSF